MLASGVVPGPALRSSLRVNSVETSYYKMLSIHRVTLTIIPFAPILFFSFRSIPLSLQYLSSSRIFAMIWFASVALLTSLLSSTLASPVLTTTISTDDATLSKRAWKVEDLNNEFKGIWWNHLFEDEGDCTPDQIDKIVYATRAAMWLTNEPTQRHGIVISCRITTGTTMAKITSRCLPTSCVSIGS
jgi:hypothetical protein